MPGPFDQLTDQDLKALATAGSALRDDVREWLHGLSILTGLIASLGHEQLAEEMTAMQTKVRKVLPRVEPA